MKKTVLASFIALAALYSSAAAECTKETCTKPETSMNWKTNYTVTTKDSTGKEYFLNIKDIKRDIHVGLASANVAGDRTADWTAGLGIGATIYDNIYVGANIDAEFINVNSDSLIGVTGELKGGYVFDPVNTAYALVGVKSMDYKNDVNGVGLGYGIGVEHKLCPVSSVAVEYKVYDMTMESTASDYNHESLGLKVKYFF